METRDLIAIATQLAVPLIAGELNKGHRMNAEDIKKALEVSFMAAKAFCEEKEAQPPGD